MEISQGKKFEKPDAGMFPGTIIDVVDMPNVPTIYGPKNKVRIMWVLGKLDNTPLLDSEGKPMTVAGFYNATISENSNLTKIVKQVLNGPMPLITSTEQLAQLLIGRSSMLFLVKSDNPKNPQDPYTNVNGAAPLPQGLLAPPIPQGYVREILRPKLVAGQATYASPQAAQQAQQAQQQFQQQPQYAPAPPTPAAPPAPVYAPAPPQLQAPQYPQYAPQAPVPGQPAPVPPSNNVKF
jgi:hypothetical protein